MAHIRTTFSLTCKDLAKKPMLPRLWNQFVIWSHHIRKPREYSNNRQEEESCSNAKHRWQYRPAEHEVPAIHNHTVKYWVIKTAI